MPHSRPIFTQGLWQDGARRRKLGAALAAVTLHASLIALFIWGLLPGTEMEGEPRPDGEAIASFEIPPPPAPEPSPTPREGNAGAPAPAMGAPEAVSQEAPEAPIIIAPVPAAPISGTGNETGGGGTQQGTGAGTGTGGAGSGAGGTGDGSGAIATPARRIAGALRDSDYPRSAGRRGIGGIVAISFRVRTDGRVDRCTVTRSSGHDVLDQLTCRLFVERYRFSPALTADGRAVESTLRTSFTWGPRRP